VLERRSIVLPGGRPAVVVVAPPDVSGTDANAALQLGRPRGVIVLNGGTEELPPHIGAGLLRSLAGLARVAAEDRVAVITGGTNAGVFAIFGQALGSSRPATCVGVAPEALVSWPGVAEPERVQLEPHHTHFLLVRGDEWGIETRAMMALAATLGAACPSIAVLAGGGEGAKREVLEHARAGREVVVLGGTGRVADELAAAAEGGEASDRDTAEIVASGVLTVLSPDAAEAGLAELLRERLGSEGSG
jgi:SLOG in TRPM, prokaryote